MITVIDLVLPLFGLIFLGYLAGKLARIPYEGLAWMNFFIVFVIAQQHRIWQERASSAVVVSTLFSMFSVTGFFVHGKNGVASSLDFVVLPGSRVRVLFD